MFHTGLEGSEKHDAIFEDAVVNALLRNGWLTAVALATTLAVAACGYKPTPHLGLSCIEQRRPDGFDHFAVSLTNQTHRTIVQTRLFVGRTVRYVDFDKPDASEVADRSQFLHDVKFTLPVFLNVDIPPHSTRTYFLRTTTPSLKFLAANGQPKPGVCFIGDVYFSDGTSWGHGVDFGVSPMKTPYVIRE